MIVKNRTISLKSTHSNDSTTFQNLEDRIKLAAKLAGGNSALAREIGSAEGTIRKWIKGDAQPKHQSLVAIASAVSISLEWLMTGEGEAQAQESQARSISAPCSPELAFLLQGSRNLHFYEQQNMEPTIHMGEIVIIDKQKTLDIATVINGVYLVEMDDLREIRRVQRLPNGHISLTNDNPTYTQSNTSIDIRHPGFQVSIVGRIYRGGQPL
jgi:phage repressor protein C with HTH and peptisase S24 domain